MNDVLLILRSYLIGIWGYRWHALAIAWVLSIIGWTIVERLPDQYQSSARVYIDTQSMLRPLMRGIAADIDTSALAQLDVVRRTLLSRPNVEEIMRDADLDVLARTPAETDRMVAELSSRIRVAGAGPNLFTISYVNERPTLAHNVVKAVLNLFVESNLGASRRQLDETHRFLGDQITQVQNNLAEAEREMAMFEMENRGFLPGSASFENRLGEARSNLARLEGERAQASRTREELNRQLSYVLREIRSGEPILSPQAARIADLEGQLNELSLRYTDLHPDIILTKRLLERERALLAQSSEEDRSAGHPAVRQLQSEIERQERVIQVYDGQIDGLQSRIALFEENLSRIPEVEAELAQKRRDLEVLRQNYSALVSRREQARFAGELDLQTEAVQFRIIDPPTEPIRPDGPNRPLMRSGVFIGSIAAGLAFAAALWLMSGTFADARRLEETFNLPVIGTITASSVPGDKTRRVSEGAAFAALTVCLLGAYVLVLVGALPLTQTSSVLFL